MARVGGAEEGLDDALNSPKLPNPRISMRLPDARVCAIASSIVFTASSASLGAS